MSSIQEADDSLERKFRKDGELLRRRMSLNSDLFSIWGWVSCQRMLFKHSVPRDFYVLGENNETIQVSPKQE